jgi:hypothetical protein
VGHRQPAQNPDELPRLASVVFETGEHVGARVEDNEARFGALDDGNKAAPDRRLSDDAGLALGRAHYGIFAR